MTSFRKMTDAQKIQRYGRELVKDHEAERLARAIRGTRLRARQGYITKATAKDHCASLWGTARAKRVVGRVRKLLGERKPRKPYRCPGFNVCKNWRCWNCRQAAGIMS